MGRFQYFCKGDCTVHPASLFAEKESSFSFPMSQSHREVSLLRFNDTNCQLEWYRGSLRRKWHVSWTEISYSATVWSNSFWNTASDESLGSLLTRILLNISEKAADRSSDLLAYLKMYRKAAFILRIDFKSTFAC